MGPRDKTTPVYTRASFSLSRLVRYAAFAILPFCSGCMTTLGYVPEYPKPEQQWWGGGPNFSETPKLGEVKEWAMDVVDGYDSRATMNRQADYVGALIAGAGAASLVGLAAFGGDRAWITGIPIGMAFLAGVAGIYSNEAKAQLYGAAANYLQRMVNNSERRLAWLGRKSTSAKREDAKSELDKNEADADSASKRVKAYIDEYKLRQADEALKSTTAEDEEKKDDAVADAKRQVASRAAADAKRQLDALAVESEMAKQRVDGLARLEDLTKRLDLPTQNDDQSKNNGKVKEGSPSQKFEALCLRDDVMDVMERVDRLINILMPSGVTDRLKGVGNTIGKTSGDRVTEEQIDQANKDLAYLNSSIVSKCGVF